MTLSGSNSKSPLQKHSNYSDTFAVVSCAEKRDASITAILKRKEGEEGREVSDYEE